MRGGGGGGPPGHQLHSDVARAATSVLDIPQHERLLDWQGLEQLQVQARSGDRSLVLQLEGTHDAPPGHRGVCNTDVLGLRVDVGMRCRKMAGGCVAGTQERPSTLVSLKRG